MGDESAPIYIEDQTAGAYLTQARDALLDCGKPGKLYGTWREGRETDLKERLSRHLGAQDRQLNLARTSILFTALSAEAYINGFLAGRLTPSDFEAIERLGTSDKYVVGTRLALGSPLFQRGSEPVQSITALFRLRHDLVHPKGKRIEVDRGSLIDPRFERFNSEAAATFIVQVADAAAALALAEEREPDAIVRSALESRDGLLAFGRTLRQGLPAPPKPIDTKKLLKRAAATPLPEAARTPGQDPRALSKLFGSVQPPDPLSPPPTVPQAPMELLTYLSSLPGTATVAMPPPAP